MSGVPDIIRATREQAGRGADWIKVYADYRWGPQGSTQPTFSEEELKALVETAHSSGRPVAVHAATAEGMRRAVLAGVDTIEHGYGGTEKRWDASNQGCSRTSLRWLAIRRGTSPPWSTSCS